MNSSRSLPRRIVVGLTSTIFAALVASGAVAQTLVSPGEAPKARPNPSPSSGKSPAVKSVKSCADYGEGFVNVPGTDTCVKLGGYLRSDAVIQRGR
jgi:hypothetical protein